MFILFDADILSFCFCWQPKCGWDIAVSNLKFYRRKKAETQEDYGLQFVVQKGKITEEHAKYILDQQTRRLSKLSGDELKAKVKASKKIVVELKNDISNKDNISKRVIKGLKELS